MISIDVMKKQEKSLLKRFESISISNEVKTWWIQNLGYSQKSNGKCSPN